MKSRGFTLIEALIALVILATTFTAVWGWYNNSTNTTIKIEQALRLPLLYEEFLVYLKLEDLQSTREGSYLIDGYQLNWQATLNRISTQEHYRRQRQWIVALFNINVTIEKDGELVKQFTTQQVSQWRDPDYVDFSEQL